MNKIIGLDPLLEFWSQHYLAEYIGNGGSKIKFITGRSGSGKTTFLNAFAEKAKSMNYCVIQFSAKDNWLYDFKDVYVKILEQCSLVDCLKSCAMKIVQELGDDPLLIPDGKTYADYLSSENRFDPLTRKEIRNQLRDFFLKNPMMDNNFALACSLLTGHILGHPTLENSSRELLLAFLSADKTVKLSLLRAQGLSPSKITKVNARHMLRSLTELLTMGSYRGLIVCIDDLDVLLNRSGMDEIHYTKNRREDTYENIRQLIDDIDSMKNVMFLYAFDRQLIDHDNAGVKSYQALWMRIQNEVIGSKLNRFADILDMDRYAEQFYSTEIMIEMANAMILTEYDEEPFTLEEAMELREKARLGAYGIPELIRRRAFGGHREVEKHV